MTALLRFELATYFKKPGIYIALLLLFALGCIIGFKQLALNAGADVHKNSPYAVAGMVGFLSLTGILFSTFVAAMTLFREADAGFTLILYATPLTRGQYLFSRFAGVFGISLSCLLMLVAGYAIGQLAAPDQAAHGPFSWWLYLLPVVCFSLPNLFLCTAVVCSVAWLTRTKLLVYLAALFLYIVYTVLLLYSGSPLVTGGSPQSPAAMALAAVVDPFGLSAFYQQTNAWTLADRNTQFIGLSGTLLLNRGMYLALSSTLLLVAWRTFRFTVDTRSAKQQRKLPAAAPAAESRGFEPITPAPTGLGYQFQVIRSIVKLDIEFALKSIPFVLVTLGLIFLMAMELQGTIDQGIRIPEQYATTGLLANRIIFNLPGMMILIILFYAHELFWRSTDSRFALIEHSTPAGHMSRFAARWIALTILVLILLTVTILTAVAFQLAYRYPRIDWLVYLGLYWLIAAPLILCAGITVVLQTVLGRKWPGLAISCVALFLLATSLGASAGITHPLLRFAAAYPAKYSDMNGWGPYLAAHSWRLGFGFSVTILAAIVAVDVRALRHRRPPMLAAALAMVVCSAASGLYIHAHVPDDHGRDPLAERADYEARYRRYQGIPQPTVTAVQTTVELYPARNAYGVQGTYSLRNDAGAPIERILVNFDRDVVLEAAHYRSTAEQLGFDQQVGFIELETPMLPGDTASFEFRFSYAWDGFTGHRAFNAIVDNGSFIRLSDYVPRFGYQSDLEIADPGERRQRNLGLPTPLTRLEAPASRASDLITLDMTIGTDGDQTAVGIGEQTARWRTADRNYVRYQATSPIPFRFGVSSAHYRLKQVTHRGVTIEVYHHAEHGENVDHLLEQAARALDYCQSNFSPYPYQTIRFAEVSRFTEGFAGTAYPATIFMTEHMIFHANLAGDTGPDVISELAGHELSHQWWGSGAFAPPEREGAKVLTETLAMYTELMLIKHASLDEARVLDHVAMHEDMYLDARGFSDEVPLYKARPEDTHLYYSKGLVSMYALTRLIGEAQVNRALQALYLGHTYPQPAPVATDLLEELYRVAPESLHGKIDELFKQVER